MEHAGRRTSRLARGLGWFSAGLGAAQAIAPDEVNRLIGIEPSARSRAIMRGVGLQELSMAPGLVAGRATRTLLCARVAGDLLHLGMLTAALRNPRNDARRLAAALANVAAVTVVDALAVRQAGRHPATELRAGATVTIRRPPEVVYDFWHDLARLPEFFTHVRSVEARGDGRTHWIVDAPAGHTVEWDAEVVEDRPGELLAWRALEGADVPNAGVVRFTPAPGDRGTELAVELEFTPPAGRLGARVAKLLGEHPEQQVRDDLRRCKQLLEVGEIVLTEGSPQGLRSQQLVRQSPAQPRD